LIPMPVFLAGLIIGGMYIDDCVNGLKLPVWSIVFGTVGFAIHLSLIVIVIKIILCFFFFLLLYLAYHNYSK
jgi:hypothetical protein